MENPNEAESEIVGEEEEIEEEEDAPDYGSSSYWDHRYQSNDSQFDWYISWEQLSQNLKPLFIGNEIILNVGCGNSPMSADMIKTTFSESPKIISIDISDVVINQMKDMYKDNDKLDWYTMDCTSLAFPDEVFDLVFDKGTLDALFCGEQSEYRVLSTLYEIERVLAPRGLFIEITYGEPKNRLNVFKKLDLGWYLHRPMIIEHPEKPGSYYYVYIFQKLLLKKFINAEEEEEDINEEEDLDANTTNCNEEEQTKSEIFLPNKEDETKPQPNQSETENESNNQKEESK